MAISAYSGVPQRASEAFQSAWSISASSPRQPSFKAPVTVPGAAMAREGELRQCTRRSLHADMRIIDDQMEPSGTPSLIPAQVLNVSYGGLYATVPLGYGISRGQRFTFELHIGERGPEPGTMQVVSQPGRILRTELMIGEDGQPSQLGIAVQFFGHRRGMIPLPSSL